MNTKKLSYSLLASFLIFFVCDNKQEVNGFNGVQYVDPQIGSGYAWGFV